MRTTIVILFIIFTLIFSNKTLHASNSNVEKDSPKFINSIEADVTGDGIREYIKIQGYLLAEDSHYFTDVWININSLFNQQWKISVHGGYSPKLELFNLTHKDTANLLYESKTDPDKEKYQYKLYSLFNGQVQQIDLPKNNYFSGKFKDNFQIYFQLNPNGKHLSENLSNKKSFYIKSGLYDEHGKLLMNQQLKLLNPIKIEATLISRSKGYGLITTQQITGLNENDIVGYLKTLWYYDKNKWIKLNNEWNFNVD